MVVIESEINIGSLLLVKEKEKTQIFLFFYIYKKINYSTSTIRKEILEGRRLTNEQFKSR